MSSDFLSHVGDRPGTPHARHPLHYMGQSTLPSPISGTLDLGAASPSLDPLCCYRFESPLSAQGFIYSKTRTRRPHQTLKLRHSRPLSLLATLYGPTHVALDFIARSASVWLCSASAPLTPGAELSATTPVSITLSSTHSVGSHQQHGPKYCFKLCINHSGYPRA